MKGVFFQKPLEFNIEIIGENFEQGDLIKGTAKVKNHDKGPIEMAQYGIILAHGEDKKSKKRMIRPLSPSLLKLLNPWVPKLKMSIPLISNFN